MSCPYVVVTRSSSWAQRDAMLVVDQTKTIDRIEFVLSHHHHRNIVLDIAASAGSISLPDALPLSFGVWLDGKVVHDGPFIINMLSGCRSCTLTLGRAFVCYCLQ